MICGVQELFVSDFQAFVIGVKGWQKKKKKKKPAANISMGIPQDSFLAGIVECYISRSYFEIH